MTLARRLLQAAAGQGRLYIEDVFSTFTYTGNGSNQVITNNIALGDTYGTTDQVSYTTPGTYLWICPAGVTSVSVVCVGAGGGSAAADINTNMGGGGGGALAYANNVSVTPGNTYTVVVGAGGSTSAGGFSSFNSTTCKANGGNSSTDGTGAAGGTVANGTGFAGGAGGNGVTNFTSVNEGAGGGGGAGGYSGVGGAGGQNGQNSGAGFGGSGGAGGGGGAHGGNGRGKGGGGVGLLGEGSSGTGGALENGGNGGSGGANAGASGAGGAPGGGTGGDGRGSQTGPHAGASGAVRIIWPGNTRSFPSTSTTDATPVGHVAGKGGMVWIKTRDVGLNHSIQSTTLGTSVALRVSGTAYKSVTDEVTFFNNNGFTLGSGSTYGEVNTSSSTYVSWTFREAANFFDVVTYTGNGTTQTISHSLGTAPGMVVIRRLANGYNWYVWHRSLTSGYYIQLESTAAQTNTSATSYFGNNSTTVDPTSTGFTVGNSVDVNSSGASYVAYLFAHDAAASGLIQCGSFTTNGSGNSSQQTLGWEPQFILMKGGTATNWQMVDNMRGMSAGGEDARVYANSSAAETTANIVDFNATGFISNGGALSTNDTYIYIAIRRGPMRQPTSGGQVYSGLLNTGDSTSDKEITGAGFPPDMVISSRRLANAGAVGVIVDKLRGTSASINTASTDAEVSDTAFKAFTMGGIRVSDTTGYHRWNYTTENYAYHMFKRAPGFFDIVCWTGTATTNRSVNHGLTVTPELIIAKDRGNGFSGPGDWWIYSQSIASNAYLKINTTAAATASSSATPWQTVPSSTLFYVGSNDVDINLNRAGNLAVAYLFATLAGVSKVGSYTGTGTTKQVDCGFSAGARFVLIKRTDSTGDWYVFDTTRGIIAGNDPYFFTNSSSAEVTNTDYVDSYSAGFEISSTAPAGLNANGGTYIFLAIA
jgi:hypothetical protein